MAESNNEEITVKIKKVKRMCTYREEWENDYKCIKKDPNNSFRAFCQICNKGFSVSHGGLNDVKRHVAGPDHQRGEKTIKKNQTLQYFMKRDQMTSEEEKVIAAELVKVYHTVRHSLSYMSTDCDAKLSSTIFPDSKIATKITLGRTKASSIIYNVLAPASLENVIKELKDAVFFSVSTDASNHGNIKLFPIIVRYYSPNSGLCNSLLDFYEDPNEKAVDIYMNIKTRLESFGLDISNVSTYSADNCNVNFGIRNSVYQLLLKDNERILPTGCPAHVLHNAVKYAIERCDFDVEHLVLKVYGHLSYHSQRVQKLKNFFAEADLEYQNIIRHVITRWLTLYPAIEKLLKGLPALKEYFLSLGENGPVNLRKYFENFKKTESFLGFFHNVLKVFYDTIKLLETRDVLCCETFDIINELRNKLKQRISDKFVGFACTNSMKSLSDEEKILLEHTLMLWYTHALQYIEKHFDFSENHHLFKLRIFSLKKEFSFQELLEVLDQLSITSRVNVDQLYEEFCENKDVLSLLIEQNTKRSTDQSITPYMQWNSFFQKNRDAPNLLKIFKFVASIPASNAEPERIFSLSGNAWSDSRNRLSVDHVKCELQVKVNFSQSCSEFYNYVLENKKLLKCSRSQEKYDFKNKK